MTCREIQAALAEDSSSRMEGDLALHLEECCDCRRFCEDLLELEELSRALSKKCCVSSQVELETIALLSRIKPRRVSFVQASLACLILVFVSVGVVFPWLDSEAPEPDAFAASDTFLIDESSPEDRADPNSRYIEVVVQDDVEGEIILRLPSVIEIRQTDPNEEFYVRNVSH